MDTFTVTATHAKQNFADLLNRVAYEKKTALIEKHGKVIVRVVPEKNTPPKKSLQEIWDSLGGSMPDFPDVTKFRRNKRRWRTFTL